LLWSRDTVERPGYGGTVLKTSSVTGSNYSFQPASADQKQATVGIEMNELPIK